MFFVLFHYNFNIAIVKLLDWYVYEDYFIIVMEYLEGFEDMMMYLDKNGSIKEKDAKKLFKKVCDTFTSCYLVPTTIFLFNTNFKYFSLNRT